MIHNETLEKQLKVANAVTFALTLLFISVCVYGIIVTRNDFAVNLILWLSIFFVIVICVAFVSINGTTVFKIQVDENLIIFESLFKRNVLPKPCFVAVENTYGKITIHSDDVNNNWYYRLYKFSGGAKKLQTPLSEIESFLTENNIGYRVV